MGALCAQAGDLEVGREATDEAFARAYARWDSVRALASPAGWTVRVGLNLVRRAARRPGLERRFLARFPPEPSVAAPRFDEVAELLAPLSPRQRTAMVSRYVADLPKPRSQWRLAFGG